MFLYAVVFLHESMQKVQAQVLQPLCDRPDKLFFLHCFALNSSCVT